MLDFTQPVPIWFTIGSIVTIVAVSLVAVAVVKKAKNKL